MVRRFILVILVLFISATINGYSITEVHEVPDSFTTYLRIVDIEGRPIKVTSTDTVIIETFFDTINTHDTILFLTSYTAIFQFIEWIKYYSGNYYIKLKPGFGTRGTTTDSIRGPWPPIMHGVHQGDTIYLFASIYLHLRWAPYVHLWNDQLSYIQLQYIWDSTNTKYVLIRTNTVLFDPLTIGRTNKRALYKEGFFWGLNIRKSLFTCDTTTSDTVCYLNYPTDLELIRHHHMSYDRYFIFNSLNIASFIADSDSSAAVVSPILHISNAGFLDDIASFISGYDTLTDGLGYITDISTYLDTYIITINGISSNRWYRFSGITESDSLAPGDSLVPCLGYGIEDSVLYYQIHNDTAVIILKALASDSLYFLVGALVKIDTTSDTTKHLIYIDQLPVGIFKIPRKKNTGPHFTRFIGQPHSSFLSLSSNNMPLRYDSTLDIPDTLGAPLFRYVALTAGIITHNDTTKRVITALIRDTILIWNDISDTTIRFHLPITIDTNCYYSEITSVPTESSLVIYALDNNNKRLFLINILPDLSWDTFSIDLPYFGRRHFVFATTSIDTGDYYPYRIGCLCETTSSDTICDSLKWDYEVMEPIVKYAYHTIIPTVFAIDSAYYDLLDLDDTVTIRNDSIVYFWTSTIRGFLSDAFDAVQWIDTKPSQAGRSNLLHQPFIYYKLPGQWHWDIRGGIHGPAVGWNHANIYHELNERESYLLAPVRNNLTDGRLRYTLYGYRNYPLRLTFIYKDPNGTQSASGLYPCTYCISMRAKYFTGMSTTGLWYWYLRAYPRYSYDFQIETDPGTFPEMIVGTWIFIFSENVSDTLTYIDTIYVRERVDHMGIRYYVPGFDFQPIDSLLQAHWENGIPSSTFLTFDFYFIDYTPPRSGVSITVLGYLNEHSADTLYNNSTICGSCIDTLKPRYINVVHRCHAGLIGITNGFLGLLLDREFDFRNDGYLLGYPTYYWDKNAETWYPSSVDSYIIDLHTYYGRPGFLDATTNCIITYNGYRYRSRHNVNPNEYGLHNLRRRRFRNGIMLPP